MKSVNLFLPAVLLMLLSQTSFVPVTAGAQDEESQRFTTAALAAPQLRAPAHGALLQSVGPLTLSWDLPPGTTQYHVQVLPFNGDGPGMNLIRNSESSYTIPSPVLGVGPYIILPGMTYSWRLRATDKATAASENDPSWGAWSEERSFTTPSPNAGSIHPQDPPLGVGATSLTPTLIWTDDSPHVFYYEIQLSNDILFNTNPATATAAVYWNLVHGGQTRPFNSWAVPASYPLEQGKRYYWRVRPRVQGNGTPVNWVSSFWFLAPGGPTLVTPIPPTITPAPIPPTITPAPVLTTPPDSLLRFGETWFGDGLYLTAKSTPVPHVWGDVMMNFTLENRTGHTLNFDIRWNRIYILFSDNRKFAAQSDGITQINDLRHNQRYDFSIVWSSTLPWRQFQDIKRDPGVAYYIVGEKDVNPRLPVASWKEDLAH